MSAILQIFIIVGLLTLLGTAALLFITLKYYWGERGTPPMTGAQRRKAHEEELQLRAKQIEHSKKNPIVTRNPNFWDNRKMYR